jgi:hypothetical protein
MYNNSRLAFFRLLNDTTNKTIETNKIEDNIEGTMISQLTSNISIKHKQLLDAYEEAQNKLLETKKQLDDFISNNPQLSVVTEQNIEKYHNMQKQLDENIIVTKPQQLISCSWDKIKSDPNNMENIVCLTNVDEMIYPYLENLTNLKTISFVDGFNATINLSELKNLEDITLGSSFNQVLSKDNLPNKLKKLKLGLNFLRKIDDLPNSIEELTLDNRFNSTIVLPSNLKSLTVGDSFNQNIILNDMLESITFGYHFNKPLTLSNSVKKLLLPGKFNEDLELNDCLEELSLGQMFNKNLKLPNSMKILTLKNRAVLSKITLNKNVKINM